VLPGNGPQHKGSYSASRGLSKPQGPTATLKAVNMGERTEPREGQVWPKRRPGSGEQDKIAAVGAGGGVLFSATLTRFPTVTTNPHQ